MPTGSATRELLAISDLHVEVAENRAVVDALRPRHPDDWLLVCGDVADTSQDIEWALARLAARFARVIWVPGNHELWTVPGDAVQLRGAARYAYLVERCRRLGVLTPEDPYPVFPGADGPVVIAPLFTLYDYSFGGGRAVADADVVCTDELVLSPDPYRSVVEWCHERVDETETRLVAEVGAGPCVLVGHFPLMRDLTRPLRYPDFALWCGSVRTADWHRRFGAEAVVYGHLHIRRTSVHDGVPFHEVSLGYPRERRRGIASAHGLRCILQGGAAGADQPAE